MIPAGGHRMPLLFWVDVSFSVIAAVMSAALMLIVLAAGLTQALNRSFLLFTLVQTVWACFSVMLRMSLWFGHGNALFLAECVAVTLLAMGETMLIFSAVYVERSRPLLHWIVGAWTVVLLLLLDPIFSHRVISNVRLHANGATLADVSLLGTFAAVVPAVFLLWSFLLFLRERRKTGEPYMAVSALILLVGFVIGGVLEIHFPVESVTHTLGIAFLGYGVLSRQLFNPLREQTASLKSQIAEREKAEEALKISLKEKEILLREVHHRVKNNLQVISSLLNLQSKKIRNRRLLEIFTESQHRIHSMALIHEQLYRTSNFDSIRMDEYIKLLVNNLCRSYGGQHRKVQLAVNGNVPGLNINKAIPCGLIINEIVSNSLKHAFPPSFQGRPKVTVEMRLRGEKNIQLTVKDNGIGLPEGFDMSKSTSLGMELIRIITEDQLQGKVRQTGGGGTVFQIVFR
jgi:two-component sensor histidine kinase